MDFSQFGASGAVVLVVFLFLKFMRDEGIKRDATYAKVARALENNVKALENNEKAVASADKYLRERNGRDAQSHKELMVAVQAIPTTMQSIADNQADAIVTAVTVKEQNVGKQTVEHQLVKDTEHQ